MEQMAQWARIVQLPDPVSALLQDSVAAKVITMRQVDQVDQAAAQVMVMVEPKQVEVPRKAAPADQIMVMKVAAVPQLMLVILQQAVAVVLAQ
jgi:hypothetical protein